jgi:hypothetical protein
MKALREETKKMLKCEIKVVFRKEIKVLKDKSQYP